MDFIRAISKSQRSRPAKELSQGVVAAEAGCSKGLADTEWKTEESLSSERDSVLKTAGQCCLTTGPLYHCVFQNSHRATFSSFASLAHQAPSASFASATEKVLCGTRFQDVHPTESGHWV